MVNFGLIISLELVIGYTDCKSSSSRQRGGHDLGHTNRF